MIGFMLWTNSQCYMFSLPFHLVLSANSYYQFGICFKRIHWTTSLPERPSTVETSNLSWPPSPIQYRPFKFTLSELHSGSSSFQPQCRLGRFFDHRPRTVLIQMFSHYDKLGTSKHPDVLAIRGSWCVGTGVSKAMLACI